MIKINLHLAVLLSTTKKDFIFYDINENNSIINYTLSSDYIRYKKKYSNYKVISCIKPSLKQLTINF